MAPKKEKKGKSDVPPPQERYDFSRAEPANPLDPRTTGSPCFGHHVVEKPGPGSCSGANKFAMWESCAQCGLRVTYIPAFGASGATRKAGPLSSDTKQQLATIPPNEQKGSIHLKDEKISMDGAEASLLRRLEQVQDRKKEWTAIQAAKTKGTTSEAPVKGTSTVTPVVRKKNRADETAEAHEAAQTDQVEEDGWELPTGPK